MWENDERKLDPFSNNNRVYRTYEGRECSIQIKWSYFRIITQTSTCIHHSMLLSQLWSFLAFSTIWLNQSTNCGRKSRGWVTGLRLITTDLPFFFHICELVVTSRCQICRDVWCHLRNSVLNCWFVLLLLVHTGEGWRSRAANLTLDSWLVDWEMSMMMEEKIFLVKRDMKRSGKEGVVLLKNIYKMRYERRVHMEYRIENTSFCFSASVRFEGEHAFQAVKQATRRWRTGNVRIDFLLNHYST